MKQDASTLYKLIILYILKKISTPMTKIQLYDFILNRDYTSYLPLHEAYSDLLDANLISSEIIGERTHLTITKEGQETLTLFNSRLSIDFKNDIDQFLHENKSNLRKENSVLANYYKSTVSGEFEAHLIAKDKDITLIDITLSVPSAPMASTICEKWKEKNETIYKFLIEQLF